MIELRRDKMGKGVNIFTTDFEGFHHTIFVSNEEIPILKQLIKDI
jgi:hypothetical protein